MYIKLTFLILLIICASSNLLSLVNVEDESWEQKAQRNKERAQKQQNSFCNSNTL